jgi:hypothetical protein
MEEFLDVLWNLTLRFCEFGSLYNLVLSFCEFSNGMNDFFVYVTLTFGLEISIRLIVSTME